MRDILAPEQRKVLDRFAALNVLLAFDFDGTLAPIVSDPRSAGLLPHTRSLLELISTQYPLVVISGRAWADVCARLTGIELSGVVGNHGLEPFFARSDFAQQVKRFRPVLASLLESIPGVVIEDKTFSVSIHYRAAPDREQAHAAILDAVSRLDAVRTVGGKLVVNVLPEGAPHKGAALELMLAHLRCDAAIYVGDDDTDEDVFAIDRPDWLLTVRVGASAKTEADYCVRDQAAVDSLLEALSALRTARAV